MRALLAAAALFVVAGCGSTTPVVGGGYKLYTAASNSGSMQLAVIDSRSHAIERKLQIGTPSGDWKHLYSVISNSLIDTDPETGATLRTLQLPRRYEMPPATISGIPGGLSQNGKWLVLEAFDRGASIPSASHLLLVDTSFGPAPVRIDLKGWFGFDAISNDGRNLYLIQYVAAQLYHVRLYQVPQHELYPNPIVEKGASPNSTMAGIKVMSVPSPDGSWLFTMYARQNEGPFIHGLSMDGTPFAACIDLPGVGYNKESNELRWSLAVNPGRSLLYAVNGSMGVVDEVNIGANSWPTLRRTSKIGVEQPASISLIQKVEAKEFGLNAAVVSPDGKTLVTAASTGIVWLDTDGMRTRARALGDWHVSSLGLTPDGRTLYALSDGGPIAEVSMASGAVGATFAPSGGYLLTLMRVAAA